MRQYKIKFISLLLITLFLTSQKIVNAQTPQPYLYTTFNRKEITLYPYVGRNVALLVPSSRFDEAALREMVAAYDNAYDYYKQITGRVPKPYARTQYNGRTTIAVVSATCGAGCAYLSDTGVEILDSFFDKTYQGFLKNRELDYIIFYELSRNFWSPEYIKKIEYKSPDYRNSVLNGFSIFMAVMSMEATGVKPAPFKEIDFSIFKTEQKKILNLYLADRSLNWDNTLRVGKVPRQELCDRQKLCLEAHDLFASFLFKLREIYGDRFLERIWREVEKRPDAKTTQDAVDNFILAASAAAGENLTDLFVLEWRWSVSDAAKLNAKNANKIKYKFKE